MTTAAIKKRLDRIERRLAKPRVKDFEVLYAEKLENPLYLVEYKPARREELHIAQAEAKEAKRLADYYKDCMIKARKALYQLQPAIDWPAVAVVMEKSPDLCCCKMCTQTKVTIYGIIRDLVEQQLQGDQT